MSAVAPVVSGLVLKFVHTFKTNVDECFENSILREAARADPVRARALRFVLVGAGVPSGTVRRGEARGASARATLKTLN